MAIIKCPGQDKRFWKTDDIFELNCPSCAAAIEFWKDDPQRKCSGCGRTVMNPKISLGCAQWCQYAKECLGADAPEPMEVSLCDRIADEMRQVFGADERRVRHAMDVLCYAGRILEAEGGSPIVVTAAAILHDVGIKEAGRKHGSSAGKYQEIEGPPIARRILEKHNVGREQIAQVCGIIASHHSARPPEEGVDYVDTLEFRIIWDADWLVNIPEECPGKSPEEMKAFIEKMFRTDAGRALALEKFVERQ